MGDIYLTNITGVKIAIQTFMINGTILNQEPTSIEPGSTLNWHYSDKTADEFYKMALIISCGNTSHAINLKREYFFCDNKGAFPGVDYDMNFALIGFNGLDISIMMSYRNIGSEIFTYCNEVKNMLS